MSGRKPRHEGESCRYELFTQSHVASNPEPGCSHLVRQALTSCLRLDRQVVNLGSRFHLVSTAYRLACLYLPPPDKAYVLLEAQDDAIGV